MLPHLVSLGCCCSSSPDMAPLDYSRTFMLSLLTLVHLVQYVKPPSLTGQPLCLCCSLHLALHLLPSSYAEASLTAPRPSDVLTWLSSTQTKTLCLHCSLSLLRPSGMWIDSWRPVLMLVVGVMPYPRVSQLTSYFSKSTHNP